MKQFGDIYPEQTQGELTMFDRMLFKGYLSGVYPLHRFEQILYHHGVLLKEFKEFGQQSTEALKGHLSKLAEAEQRPIVYLPGGQGVKGESKEELARQQAETDQIESGLIVIYSTLELKSSLSVRGERASGHIRLVSELRKQLHYYLYYQDEEFGLMHVRIQSWWPFTIHIYINGREWLARQLDKAGIGYLKVENCFWQIADLPQAQKLADKFAHRQWERVWEAFAKKVNPLWPTVQAWTGQGYYWTIEQAEIATDVMFDQPETLAELLPALFQETLLTCSAEDVMRFLGRRLHASFQGKVETRLNKRQPGWRVKHWVKQNSIKMYNKGPVLRVETTINKADEFKIPTPPGHSSRWKRLPKGVAYCWHFYNVGQEANHRYLQALRPISYQGKAATETLDSLCQSQPLSPTHRVAKFQPVTEATCQLFAAVLNGQHALTGFRNHHLRTALFPTETSDPQTEHRLRARVSRLLLKLRGHGLIQKVDQAHLYRVTAHGYRAMAAALRYRHIDFPTNFALA